MTGIAGQVLGWHWDWVSVEDRLPKSGIDVLVFDGCDIYIAQYDDSDPDDCYWMQEGMRIHYTKHWMPLPSPPQPKEQELCNECGHEL